MAVRLAAISWKALLFGGATILILGLMMQLAFLIIAVWQVMLIKRFPESTAWAQAGLYLIGVLLFFTTMAVGGYVTARVAGRRLIWHGTVVAVTAGSVSFIQSLNVGGLTLSGALLFLLGIPFTLVGCWISRRRHAHGDG
ncbi:hypothetical protein [Sedimenticola sp.]|uniref:hypothetical protein n=1 Tax=Sedimenticola sp. TaxID=1940285 RepID=UPI003D0B8504